MDHLDMDGAIRKRIGWNLSQEAFDKFLSYLHVDRSVAGGMYEKLRAKLISFFAWRGWQFADDHADETINRVIRKIDEGAEIREVATYIYGVARLLLLELAKEREKQNLALKEMPTTNEPEEMDDDLQARLDCLQRCLQTLSPENRQMILDYYHEEKGAKIDNRKLLAERLDIPLNALRIRVLRLREKLEKCITSCQQQMRKGRVPRSNLYRLEKRWN